MFPEKLKGITERGESSVKSSGRSCLNLQLIWHEMAFPLENIYIMRLILSIIKTSNLNSLEGNWNQSGTTKFINGNVIIKVVFFNIFFNILGRFSIIFLQFFMPLKATYF